MFTPCKKKVGAARGLEKDTHFILSDKRDFGKRMDKVQICPLRVLRPSSCQDLIALNSEVECGAGFPQGECLPEVLLWLSFTWFTP